MTTLGPTLIYLCSSCKGLYKQPTIASGNTIGARVRSDGRMYAPMLPVTPPLVSCPHCASVFRLKESEPIAEFDEFMASTQRRLLSGENLTAEQIDQKKQEEKLAIELAIRYEMAPEYGEVTATQCLDYLERTALDLPTEKNIRRFALWLTNDAQYPQSLPRRFMDRRYENLMSKASWDLPVNNKMSPSAESNAKKLLSILNESIEGELILKAELFRELGRYSESCELLNRDLDNGVVAEQILQMAEAESSAPFIFAAKDDQYDFEYAWKARRYEPERPLVPIAQLDPPIFKINNRDWYVKVLGMLSHNWALVQENDDNTATVYFFHDHTENERPAVIDSMVFEDEVAAWDWLELKGFDLLKNYPGPWMGCEPKGYFYDARGTTELVYSLGGGHDF